MKVKVIIMLLFVFAYLAFGTNAHAKAVSPVNSAATSMQMTLTNTVLFYAGSQDINDELCKADKNYSVTVQQQFNNMVYGTAIEDEDFTSKLITLIVMFLFISIMCAFTLSGSGSKEEFDPYR